RISRDLPAREVLLGASRPVAEAAKARKRAIARRNGGPGAKRSAGAGATCTEAGPLKRLLAGPRLNRRLSATAPCIEYQPRSAKVRGQFIRQALEVGGRERAGLWLFLPAVERDLFLGAEHERPLAGGNFNFAGVDQAARL